MRVFFIVIVLLNNISYLTYTLFINQQEINIWTLLILIFTISLIVSCMFNFTGSKRKTISFHNIDTHSQLLVKKENNKYTFSISNISLSNERKQNVNIEAKKLIVITGEIENIDSGIVSLSHNDLFIYDKSGKRLSFYPLFDTQEAAIHIPMGRAATFQYAYALNDDSNDIEIEYFPDITWKKPAGTWKINVIS